MTVIPDRTRVLINYQDGLLQCLSKAMAMEEPPKPKDATPSANVDVKAQHVEVSNLLDSAFSLDDKNLMTEYNIVLVKSKRTLVIKSAAEQPTPANPRPKRSELGSVKIKIHMRRKRIYSAAKFESYVKTKAKNALSKAVEKAQSGESGDFDGTDGPSCQNQNGSSSSSSYKDSEE